MRITRLLKRVSGMILAVYLVVTALLLSPKIFGYQICMAPDQGEGSEIRTGAAVFSRPVLFMELHTGDLAVCSLDQGRTMMIQRIVFINTKQGWIKVKRSSANSPEPVEESRISKEAILGKAELTIPWIGRWYWFVSFWEGKTLWIAYGLWMLAVWQLIKQYCFGGKKEGC